jgi:hypothetical protein
MSASISLAAEDDMSWSLSDKKEGKKGLWLVAVGECKKPNWFKTRCGASVTKTNQKPT